MDSSEYLCKDCKHSFVDLSMRVLSLGFPDSIWYKCRKAFIPENVEFDPVKGNKKLKGKYLSCSMNRKPFHACKPEAELWAPQHKKDLFKALTKERNV